jgi:hypothetical protein
MCSSGAQGGRFKLSQSMNEAGRAGFLTIVFVRADQLYYTSLSNIRSLGRAGWQQASLTCMSNQLDQRAIQDLESSSDFGGCQSTLESALSKAGGNFSIQPVGRKP